MDGELVLRCSVPRVPATDDAMDVELSTYSYLDGALVETSFVQRMATGLGFGEGHTLQLGEHPVAKELASLRLPADPVMTAWSERMQGTFEAPRALPNDTGVPSSQ